MAEVMAIWIASPDLCNYLVFQLSVLKTILFKAALSSKHDLDSYVQEGNFVNKRLNHNGPIFTFQQKIDYEILSAPK